MENPGNRLSKKTLFAYGCGDFASNLCWTFVGSYLSVFYTDVVGMAPADRKSTRLNSSHSGESRMPSSA